MPYSRDDIRGIINESHVPISPTCKRGQPSIVHLTPLHVLERWILKAKDRDFAWMSEPQYLFIRECAEVFNLGINCHLFAKQVVMKYLIGMGIEQKMSLWGDLLTGCLQCSEARQC